MHKQILIIDYTAQHPEVVNALVEIFKQHRVQLAVTELFVEKFMTQNSTLAFTDVLVKSADCSNRQWLRRIAPLIATQDIVIFSTPIKDRLLRQTLSLETGGCKILFLHNVNYFLERNLANLQSFIRPQGVGRLIIRQLPTYFWELVKHWRNQLWLWKQHAFFTHLNRHTDLYCFANESVEGYFREKSGLRNTLTLPTNAGERTGMESVECPPYRVRLNIAILGNVSQLRKDYLQVINTLQKANLRRPVTLSLLGICPDPMFAKKLAALIRGNTNPNLEIRFNPAQLYIPTPELVKLLDDVHFLLSPIQPNMIYRFHREIYGVSKASGSEGDCLAYKRPLLLPKSYRCADHIKPMIVRYTDMEDLVTIINKLNDEEALTALYRRLRTTAKHFSCDSFSKVLEQATPTPGPSKIVSSSR